MKYHASKAKTAEEKAKIIDKAFPSETKVAVDTEAEKTKKANEAFQDLVNKAKPDEDKAKKVTETLF